MIIANSHEQVLKLVGDNSLTLLYVAQSKCSTSLAIEEKLLGVNDVYPDWCVVKAELAEIPLLASSHTVLAAPTLLLLVENKEVFRGDRYLRFQDLEQQLLKWQEFITSDASNRVVPGKKYRHYKGNEYIVLHIAKHTETLDELVVYSALADVNTRSSVWARPLSMFIDTVLVDDNVIKRFKELD